MNYLGVDYGTKQIGLAVSVGGIISPLVVLPNNPMFFQSLQRLVEEYLVDGVYVGVSHGKVADKTNKFVTQIRGMLKCSVETVEEAVSTIEAGQIYKNNRNKRKDYKGNIDSVAAAVILRRVID